MHLARILRTTSFRLGAIYASVFGGSVIVLVAIINWIANDAMNQQLRAAIGTELAALLYRDSEGGAADVTAAVEERLQARNRPTAMFYLLTDPAGGKITGNLHAQAPAEGWLELHQTFPVAAGTAHEPGALETRTIVARAVRLTGGGTLFVGEDRGKVDEVRAAILEASAWAISAAILLAAVGGVLVSLGFLRRVDAINRTSRAIIDGRLAQRIPTRGTGDELDQLGRNLNEMLDRIQALMESVRQVSSDIAHDLRTPLSRLRQRLEAARLRAASIADYEATVDHAIADADAILDTFTALLRIAQIESGTRRSAFAPIDLSEVFRSLVETYAAVAEDRAQALTSTVKPAIGTLGDRELLTQMIANLIENAIRHAPSGARIRVELRRCDETAVAMVADSGPGIPPDQRARVFERFYRLERSRTSPGSGLGLALVAAVAEIHAIKIALEDNQPGLRVVLTIPAIAAMTTAEPRPGSIQVLADRTAERGMR
jgi:signal transduction histidine kinase